MLSSVLPSVHPSQLVESFTSTGNLLLDERLILLKPRQEEEEQQVEENLNEKKTVTGRLMPSSRQADTERKADIGRLTLAEVTRHSTPVVKRQETGS